MVQSAILHLAVLIRASIQEATREGLCFFGEESKPGISCNLFNKWLRILFRCHSNFHDLPQFTLATLRLRLMMLRLRSNSKNCVLLLLHGLFQEGHVRCSFAQDFGSLGHSTVVCYKLITDVCRIIRKGHDRLEMSLNHFGIIGWECIAHLGVVGRREGRHCLYR